VGLAYHYCGVDQLAGTGSDGKTAASILKDYWMTPVISVMSVDSGVARIWCEEGHETKRQDATLSLRRPRDAPNI